MDKLILIGIIFLFVAAAESDELEDLLPIEQELDSYAVIENPEFFDQGDLWRRIDGAAPHYLSFGCQRAVFFAVSDAENELDIQVDVYQMADTLGAFGIFSSERYGDVETADIGIQSYQTDNALFFWQDRYYVKLVAADFVEKHNRVLIDLGLIIAGKITRRGGVPGHFRILPTELQRAGSRKYIKEDVLAQSYLSDGFIAEYDSFSVYLIANEDSAVAGEKFKRYLNTLMDQGKISNTTTQMDMMFFAVDGYYGPMVFARCRDYIIGILGLPKERAVPIMKTMEARISSNPLRF